LKSSLRSALVILTRNEIEGISVLFGKIPFDATDERFVVDGGSTDGTVEFFQERNITVLGQDERGRGAAFRVAMASTDSDYIIFYSPDGNEDPEDIPKLIDKMEEGYDMVICSRFLPEGANEEDDLVFPWRAWANRAFTKIANFLWGGRLTDSINGFRAIRKDAFNKLKPDGPGYVIEYQLSIRALKKELRVAEIPTIEGQRIGGESYAESLPTGFLFLRFLYRELKTRKNF